MEMYRRAFRYADRTAEVFMLFEKIHQYIIRVGPAGPWHAVDRALSGLPLPNGVRRYFSFLQHIYFSDSKSPEAFRCG
jgi:hypothetical protein